MKIKTVLAAAGLALGATAGSALADYTYPTFSLSGDRAQVNTFSGIDLSTIGTPTAGLYTGAEIFLDWSSTGNSATNSNNAWSSEARSAFASAAGSGTGPTYPGGTTNYTATVGTPTNGASNANNVLNLRFNQTFGQTYNAANPLFWNIRQAFTGFTTQDVTWANIRITLKSFVPPTPPTAIDLGSIGTGSGNTMLMGSAAYNSISPVQWFKFTLTESIPAATVNKWLSIDTLGNTLNGGLIDDRDTEIALYDANGFAIGNNDDHNPGSGTLRESILTYGDLPSSDFAGYTGTGLDNGALAAGVYYIAVSPFNLGVAGGFGATHSPLNGTAGDYKVTVRIPAPGSMALLGLGGLLAARRRRA